MDKARICMIGNGYPHVTVGVCCYMLKADFDRYIYIKNFPHGSELIGFHINDKFTWSFLTTPNVCKVA